MNPTEKDRTSPSPDFDRWVRNVWQVVEDIPRGHVLTYGEVARLAGMSRAARRVGQALRRAPGGRNLPWHRVVNAEGRISFPADSSGYREQKELLQEEGVVFVDGRIDLDKFGYRGALDHLLWSEPV